MLMTRPTSYPAALLAGLVMGAALVSNYGLTASGELDVRELEAPAAPGSGMYSLAAGADGHAYLSWIEAAGPAGVTDVKQAKAHAMRFSRLEGDKWSAPGSVASGDDWFVNWADHPSLTALADGTLVAHWLVNNGQHKGAYGYGLRIARSTDRGATWREAFRAGTENVQDYSGFVTLLPRGNGFLAAYLTPVTPDLPTLASHEAGAADDHHEVEHVKTLSIAEFGADGALVADRVVDADTCTCCPTTFVDTADGPIVAYRDHDPGEIRDMSIVGQRDGRWTAPAAIHRDGWRINACPTNGPVLAASVRRVAAAWFTAANDQPRVKLAFSSDSGATFGTPVSVDEGHPIGWPAIALLDDGGAAVTWLESSSGRGEVRLRRVWPDGRLGTSHVVAAVQPGRSTGVLQMVRTGAELVLAWRTDRVMTALVTVLE